MNRIIHKNTKTALNINTVPHMLKKDEVDEKFGLKQN